MVWQTTDLLLHTPFNWNLGGFVFFATICSYNFHWYLSHHSAALSARLEWAHHHKHYHFILFWSGGALAAFFFLFITEHWFWLLIGSLLTFLYSAPKLPQKAFQWLKTIAIGKTIFLAAVWTYVTTILPLIVSDDPWRADYTWFFLGRFFYIYAICILFDYRDKEDDKEDGVRSMITYFDERGINNLFAISMILFTGLTLLLFHYGHSWKTVVSILIPGAILTGLYNYAKKNFSDYLYYFVLDGLMMAPALLMLLAGV
jgi:4-hydroxybenzoate polyprenyltransferase